MLHGALEGHCRRCAVGCWEGGREGLRCSEVSAMTLFGAARAAATTVAGPVTIAGDGSMVGDD